MAVAGDTVVAGQIVEQGGWQEVWQRGGGQQDVAVIELPSSDRDQLVARVQLDSQP